MSFIIPVYNASQTIVRCLDSVYALHLLENEFEVLVIDDCSTDESVQLLREYQKTHANMKVWCQPQNHRQGAARNLGLDKATGDFIVFLDSDDEVAEGMLQAVRLAVEQQLEMVAIRSEEVSAEGEIMEEVYLPYQEGRVFTGVELQTEHPYWRRSPWAFIYQRRFLEHVNYPFAEDVFYEDSDFVNVHLYHAQRMAYCDTCSYHAYENAASTTHTVSYKHLADYALLGTRMLAFYESLPDKSSEYAEGILEGGSYNIMIAFKRLLGLRSFKKIKAFFGRFDARYDRKRLLDYRKPAYCWTRWTRFCLRFPRVKSEKE